MSKFRLGPELEGREAFTLWFRGILYPKTYINHDTYHTDPGIRHERRPNPSILWSLHLRALPGPLHIYIHEATPPSPAADDIPPRVIHADVALWGLAHEQQSEREVHVLVPKTKHNRIYEIFLYRFDERWKHDAWHCQLPCGEVAPLDAVVPPAMSGFAVTYFDGGRMSAREVEQGFAWNAVMRWLDEVDQTVPPSDDEPCNVVECRDLMARNVDVVAVGEEGPKESLGGSVSPGLGVGRLALDAFGV